MSNVEEVVIPGNEETEELSEGLREDNFQLKETPAVAEATKPSFVKPILHVADAGVGQDVALTPAQVIAIAKIVEDNTRKAINEAKFDSSMAAQVIPRAAVPITDFSKITLDDVYDLSVPIEAKPFMSADVLTVLLKDTNYEARWVNINPQNLGDKIAKGFTYIDPKDLQAVNAIQTGLDAEGHYRFNDVVAMKIDKATYYRALRAAHERAVSTTNEAVLHKRAAQTASGFMGKSEFGNDFKQAQRTKKMEFYSPNIEV